MYDRETNHEAENTMSHHVYTGKQTSYLFISALYAGNWRCIHAPWRREINLMRLHSNNSYLY